MYTGFDCYGGGGGTKVEKGVFPPPKPPQFFPELIKGLDAIIVLVLSQVS